MKDFNGSKVFSLEYDKETLKDMVLEKQEEIERLNKELDIAIDICNKRQVEIVRLNNIINELEKWVIEDNICFEIRFDMGRCVNYQCILDKLKELKENSK